MPEPKYDKFEEKKEKSKMTLLPEDMKKGILNLPAIPYLTTPHHTIPYHTIPEDMKKGILNLPASTRSRSDWRLEPSKGRAPHTSTYSTTPRLCNEGALPGVPSVLELPTNLR